MWCGLLEMIPGNLLLMLINYGYLIITWIYRVSHILISSLVNPRGGVPMKANAKAVAK
jgi:hypothetical protein